MWLLRLPSFRNTRCRVPSKAAVSSFVVVLPTLPVIATTRAPDRRRTARAMRCSAATVSSTTTETCGPVSGGSAEAWATMAPAAPLPNASATNRCPSKRAPRMATNTSPGRTRRLSIANRPSSVSGRPRWR